MVLQRHTNAVIVFRDMLCPEMLKTLYHVKVGINEVLPGQFQSIAPVDWKVFNLFHVLLILQR